MYERAVDSVRSTASNLKEKILKLLKILLTMLAASITPNAMSSEEILNENIEHLYTYNTYAVIKLNGISSNSDQCDHINANKYVAIVFSSGKEQFSSALASYMAGRRVGFATDGAKRGAAVQYLKYIELMSIKTNSWYQV